MVHGYRASFVVSLLAMMLVPSAASAQVDFSGSWANKRLFENNSEEHAVGDYAGTPMNAASRLRADSWSASILTLPEHQCKPHGSDRIDNVSNLKIWQESNPESHKLIAYHMNVEWMNPQRVIYMDGRPHPPEYAPHTFMGFSTGQFDGNTLTVTTTHLKGAWLKRGGIERTENATVVEHFIRHGDFLIWTVLVSDPAYLTEPFIHSTSYKNDPAIPPFIPYPCESVEEIVRPQGQVPHHLPGTNNQLAEWADHFGIPHEAARGGAETMYPEYDELLKQQLNRPGATPR